MQNGDDMIAEGGPINAEGSIEAEVSPATLGKLLRATLGPTAPKGAFAAGPRNLPKPDARKKLRRQQRESRRVNR